MNKKILMLSEGSPPFKMFADNFDRSDRPLDNGWTILNNNSGGGYELPNIYNNAVRCGGGNGACVAQIYRTLENYSMGDYEVTGTFGWGLAGINWLGIAGVGLFSAATPYNNDFAGTTGVTVIFDYVPVQGGAGAEAILIRNGNATVASIGFTYTNGITYKYRVKFVNKVCYVKLWNLAGAEPTNWTLQASIPNPDFRSNSLTLFMAAGATSAWGHIYTDNIEVTKNAKM